MPSGGRVEIENVKIGYFATFSISARPLEGTFQMLAEVKLKMSQIALFLMFSISALPPEGAFQMLTHLHHLWPLGQINDAQISDRRSGYKIIKQNVQRGLIFSVLAPCICTILKSTKGLST